MEDKLLKHFTDSIYYELEKTAKTLRILGVQFFEKINVGIGAEEHAALDTISRKPDICQRDLAKLILKDRANTGKILNSLEKKGLINRCIDTKNNRLVKKVRATLKGEKILNEINKKFEIIFNELRVVSDISCEEVDKIQESIKRFRLSVEKIVDLKI